MIATWAMAGATGTIPAESWSASLPVWLAALAIVGAALGGVGLLVGIRIGARSVERLLDDVRRCNRLLAEQNRALVEQNADWVIRWLGQPPHFNSSVRSQRAEFKDPPVYI